MSMCTNYRRSIQIFAVMAAFFLIAQQAHAHEAHKERSAAASAVEDPVAVPSVAVETLLAAGMSNAEAAPKEPTTLLSWIARLHPLVVHFPIAFFATTIVAESLFAATRRDLFRHALRFMLWGGGLSAVVAVALGWAFAATGPRDHGRLLEVHRWSGTAVAVLGLAVLGGNEWIERAGGSRALLRLSLAAVAVLVAATGFLGGSLLYGIDHLVWEQQ